MAEALRLEPRNGEILFNAAIVYGHDLQNIDEGLHYLQAAITNDYPVRNAMRHPELAAVRADPRFQEVVKVFKP